MSLSQSRSSTSTVTQQIVTDPNALSGSLDSFIKFMDPETGGLPLSDFYSPKTSHLGEKQPTPAPVSTHENSMTVYQANSRPDVTISYRLEGSVPSDIRPVGIPAEVELAPAWITTKLQPNGKSVVDGAWIKRPGSTSDAEKCWTLIGSEAQSLPPIFAQEAGNSGTLEMLAVFVREAELDNRSQLPSGHTHVDHCSEFVYASKPLNGYSVSTDWTPHLSQLGTLPPTN